MDRVPTNLDFVADALQLIASPACACDAAGMVFAANHEMRVLCGAAVNGSLFIDLFSSAALEQGAARVHAARESEQRWESVLRVVDEDIAVQVVAKPLPAGAGATFVLTDLRRFEG